ncbi:MAG: hypothetical protein ACKVY0_22180 [Prosthecobacter sp.]|uniref:hypothetical protein n=1 Tax=Prosthecobacter sp. TaxID=1965333 RepID=UPI0038FF72B6
MLVSVAFILRSLATENGSVISFSNAGIQPDFTGDKGENEDQNLLPAFSVAFILRSLATENGSVISCSNAGIQPDFTGDKGENGGPET